MWTSLVLRIMLTVIALRLSNPYHRLYEIYYYPITMQCNNGRTGDQLLLICGTIVSKIVDDIAFNTLASTQYEDIWEDATQISKNFGEDCFYLAWCTQKALSA
jgi:hypothetical protein